MCYTESCSTVNCLGMRMQLAGYSLWHAREPLECISLQAPKTDLHLCARAGRCNSVLGVCQRLQPRLRGMPIPWVV